MPRKDVRAAREKRVVVFGLCGLLNGMKSYGLGDGVSGGLEDWNEGILLWLSWKKGEMLGEMEG